MRRLAALALALLTCEAAAQDPALLVTADNRGAMLPCQSCGSDGLGGLARRATLFASRTDEVGASLRLDAGNAFFGGSVARAVAVRRAYEALGYRAVNLSWRDLRCGRQGLETLLTDAGLPFVSANLRRENGEPFAAPFVVVEVGGQRIAVLGLTERPAGIGILPHLQRQLRGVTISDPAAALAEQLPKARAVADAVVLLYYGALPDLEPLLRQHGEQLAAVAVGGVEPDALPTSVHGVPLLAGLDRGREVVEWTLGAEPTPRRLTVRADLKRDAIVARIVAAATAPPAATAQEPRAVPAVPDLLEVGDRLDVAVSGGNRALRIEVTSVALSAEVDGLVAPAGRAWLVADTVWENTMPGDLAYGLGYGEGGRVAGLSKRLFARVDGDVAVRLSPERGAPSRLSEEFALDEIGSRHSGRTVFSVPAQPLRDVSLHFYSQKFAPIRVQIVGSGADQAAPIQKVQAMPLFELGVYGFELADTLGEVEPPFASKFAIVDLRGRSRLEQPTDARALRADAATDAVENLPLLAEYPKADATLHLLVDGEFVRAPEWSLGTLDPKPAFFPDRAVGGRLVFRVPADARSLVLVCAFGELRLTTGDGPGKVLPLRFPLLGRPMGPVSMRSLARVDDSLRVEVLRADAVSSFAGKDPAEGQAFVLVRLRVRNRSKDDGVYKPYERFELAGALPDAITRSGPHAPPEAVFLVAGGSFGCELVFSVPAGAASLPLACRTVTRGLQHVDLVFDATAKPQTAEPPPASQAEAETGDQPSPPAKIEPRKPLGLPGVGLTAQQVNEAIERGRAFLWAQVQRELDGKLEAFPSRKEQVLAALALVHSGAHHAFPECGATLRRYLEQAPIARYRTYQLGIFAMTVDAYGDPGFYHWLSAIAQSLVDGQHPDGSWSYTVPSVEPVDDETLAARGDGMLQILEDTDAIELQAADPAKRSGKGGDNSTSQFAALGLRAAARRGVEIPADTWSAAVELFRQRQHADGGWNYVRGSGYGSMTCAGITGVVLGRWGQGVEQPQSDPAVDRALAWLDANFSVTSNPKHHTYHYYALYSLERVGRLLNSEFIGRHEWYPQGARVLIDRQQKDGSWKDKDETVVPTAFALLFLTRATEKLVEEEPEGPAVLHTAVRLPPPTDHYFVLDASGSMLSQLDGRRKFDAAREALRGLVTVLQPEQKLALRVFGHRRTALDEGADEDTELLVAPRAADRNGQDLFLAALEKLRPRGKTPLAESLEQAAADLRKLRGRPVTVVLLTDGGEDTRKRRDPVAAARTLAKPGNVRLEVIGFDIGRPTWSKQLRAMASAADGRYWSAATAADLATVVHAAVDGEAGTLSILNARGEEVAAGAWGTSFELPPGVYTLRARIGGVPHDQTVRLGAGRTARAVFDVERVRDHLSGKTGR